MSEDLSGRSIRRVGGPVPENPAYDEREERETMERESRLHAEVIERGDVHPLRWATYGDMTDEEIAEYLGSKTSTEHSTTRR